MKEKKFKGWFITIIGAFFFFYTFFQVNMMSSLNSSFVQTYNIGPSAIALLSSYFFYANMIFVIPAGLILDRYPVRIIIISSMVISVIGVLTLTFAPNICWASIARFISGFTMAFAFISCFKLASLVLPSKHWAFASSLIITIGMLGGICSHLPMKILIVYLGCRWALFIVALLGVLITFFMWLFIHPIEEKNNETKKPVFKSLVVILKQAQNWFCGFFTCLLNLPVAVLGALFGMSYIEQVYRVSKIQAGSVTSFIFLGMIIGSLFFGWLSDFLKNRRIPMAFGGVLCLCSVIVLFYNFSLSLMLLHLLFFLIGFTSASQVLSFPMIAESNKPEFIASALSLAVIIIVGVGYGLSLPVVGYLLENGWQGQILDGVRFYSLEVYRSAFLIIPIGIFISLFLILFMKETYLDKNRKTSSK
jgi:predicted MFS family arabinose efflux permease